MKRLLVGRWFFVALLACVSGLAVVSSADDLAAASPEQIQPLGFGQVVPDAPLLTLTGAQTTLREVLGGRPTVLVFFRGGWCPYCMVHLAGLQAAHDDLAQLGYQVVAISPDAVASMAAAAADKEVRYTLLGDVEMKAMLGFGLAFGLDAKTLATYRGYGIELQPTPGSDAKLLPVPAVYLISAQGKIDFVHFDPDYKRRLGPAAVVAAARAAQAAEIQVPLREETVVYREGDTLLEGLVVYPATGDVPRPAVVVVHDWNGLNDYAKRRSRQLAALGYLAFAADIYGQGVRASSPAEAGRLAGIYKADRALLRRRMLAAVAAVRSNPQADGDRVAAIGYCFGGTAVLELARSGADVRGVVSFHGGLDRSQDVATEPIRASVLVCHGAVDPHVPATEVAALQEELQQAGADWQLVAYGDAVHSFTNPAAGSQPQQGSAYQPLADLRSWEHLQRFLSEIFR